MKLLIAAVAVHIPGILVFYELLSTAADRLESIAVGIVSIACFWLVVTLLTPRKSYNVSLTRNMANRHIIKRRSAKRQVDDEVESAQIPDDEPLLDTDEDDDDNASEMTKWSMPFSNTSKKSTRQTGSASKKKMAGAAAALLLSNALEAESVIISGSYECCTELMALKPGKFCKQQSRGNKFCEVYEKDEIIKMPNDRSMLDILTYNDKLICYNTDRCDAIRETTIKWVMIAVLIFFTLSALLKSLNIYRMYMTSPVKEIKTYEVVNGKKQEITKYSYVSWPRYALLLILMTGSMYTVYVMASRFINTMSAEAAAPNVKDMVMYDDIEGNKFRAGLFGKSNSFCKVVGYNKITKVITVEYSGIESYVESWNDLYRRYSDKKKSEMNDIEYLTKACVLFHPATCPIPPSTAPQATWKYNVESIMSDLADRVFRCEEDTVGRFQFTEGGMIQSAMNKHVFDILIENDIDRCKSLFMGIPYSGRKKQNKTMTTAANNVAQPTNITTTTTTTARATTKLTTTVFNSLSDTDHNNTHQNNNNSSIRKRGVSPLMVIERSKLPKDDSTNSRLPGGKKKKYVSGNIWDTVKNQEDRDRISQLMNEENDNPYVRERRSTTPPDPLTPPAPAPNPPAPSPPSPQVDPQPAPASQNNNQPSSQGSVVSKVLFKSGAKSVNSKDIMMESNIQGSQTAHGNKHKSIEKLTDLEVGCHDGIVFTHQGERLISKICLSKKFIETKDYNKNSITKEINEKGIETDKHGVIINSACHYYNKAPSIDYIYNQPNVTIDITGVEYVDPICKTNHLPQRYYDRMGCIRIGNNIIPMPRRDNDKSMESSNWYSCDGRVDMYHINTDTKQIKRITNVGVTSMTAEDDDNIILPGNWHGDFVVTNYTDPWFRGGMVYYTQTSQDCTTNCPVTSSDPKFAFMCCNMFKMVRSCGSGRIYVANKSKQWNIARCYDVNDKKIIPEYLDPLADVPSKTTIKDTMVDAYNKIGPSLPGAADLQLLKGCKEDASETIRMTNIKVFKMLKGMDSVQPTGTPKYFTYAGVIKFDIPSVDMNKFLRYFYQLKEAYSLTNDTCGPNIDIKGHCMKDNWLGGNVKFWNHDYTECTVDINWIEVVERTDPTIMSRTTVYPQDQSRSMTVLKFKLALVTGSTGHVYDFAVDTPSNTFNHHIDCGVSVSTCTMILDYYIAAKIYGPSITKIKALGMTIDTVQLRPGVCDDHNAFKYNDDCLLVVSESAGLTIPVLSYPMLNDKQMIVMAGKSNKEVEFFNFMATQPKCCSANYLPKTSGSPAFTYGFTKNGICVDVNTNTTGTFCDGIPAVKSEIGYMFTSVIVSGELPTCKRSDTYKITCTSSKQSTINYMNQYKNGTTSSTTSVGTIHNININDTKTLTITTSNDVYILSGMDSLSNYTYFAMWLEMFHRDPYVTVSIFTSMYIGITMLISLIIAIILAFFNTYYLGKLARLLRIKMFVKGEFHTVECNDCNNTIYNRADLTRHNCLCHRLACPYCVRKKEGNMAEKFRTSNGFKSHMTIHRWTRRNVIIGYIMCCRTLRAASTLVLISALMAQSDANKIGETVNTAQRSPNVGKNITIPNSVMTCNSNECRFTGMAQLKLPMIDKAQFVLSTTTGSTHYSNTYRISNPRLSIECGYLYSATHVTDPFTHTAFQCRNCVVDCSSITASTTFCDDVCALKASSTPVDDYYCPKMKACLTRFNNLYDSMCGLSINDGSAANYFVCKPDVNKPVMSVFECKVTDTQADIVNNDVVVQTVSMFDQGVQTGMMFDSENVVPMNFKVGVLNNPGSSLPIAIYYGLPARDQTAGTYLLPFTTVDIPLEVGCTPDMAFEKMHGNIQFTGDAIKTNAYCYQPKLTPSNIAGSYPEINKIIKCNFEGSRLVWNKRLLDRTPTFCDKTQDNKQISVQTPSLIMDAVKCVTGELKVTVDSDSELVLRAVISEVAPSKITCSGYYNRNMQTMFSIETSDTSGMVKIDCSPSGGGCTTELSNDKTCNVTVPLPAVYTCLYNDIQVSINCTSLTLAPPDNPSGDYSGDTHSDEWGTWGGSFWDYLWGQSTLGKLFTTLLILVSIVAIVKLTFRIISAYKVNKIVDKKKLE